MTEKECIPAYQVPTYQVRIDSAGTNSWYATDIGKVFTVKECSSDEAYWVLANEDKFILKRHCTIMDEKYYWTVASIRGPSTREHPTEKDARDEAKRLAHKHCGTNFSVWSHTKKFVETYCETKDGSYELLRKINKLQDELNEVKAQINNL